jgi:hypothetical protein
MARSGLFSGLARPIIYRAGPLLGRAKITGLRDSPFSPVQMYSNNGLGVVWTHLFLSFFLFASLAFMAQGNGDTRLTIELMVI